MTVTSVDVGLDRLLAAAVSAGEVGRLSGADVAVVRATAEVLAGAVDRAPTLEIGGSVLAAVHGAVTHESDLIARWMRVPAVYVGLVTVDGRTGAETVSAWLGLMHAWSRSVEAAVAHQDAGEVMRLGEQITARYGIGWEPPPPAEITAGTGQDDGDAPLPAWARMLRRVAVLLCEVVVGLSAETFIVAVVLLVALVLVVGGAR